MLPDPAACGLSSGQVAEYLNPGKWIDLPSFESFLPRPGRSTLPATKELDDSILLRSRRVAVLEQLSQH
ncbi:hypothetical protein HYQ46_002212 [Verticillium longisporum]|nr:hypothetical protein HYQ46_002212 [Verticillium longisporum]